MIATGMVQRRIAEITVSVLESLAASEDVLMANARIIQEA